MDTVNSLKHENKNNRWMTGIAGVVSIIEYK